MKKFLAIFISFLVLGIIFLMFTNPSIKRFKEFTGKYRGVNEKIEDRRRVRNYFIFSIYTAKTLSNDQMYMLYDEEVSSFEHYYIGIAGNFFWKKTKRLEVEGSGINYPYVFPEEGSSEDGYD